MHNRSDFHIICGLINRNVVEHQLTLQRQQHVSAACDALVILHAMGTSEESAEQQIAKVRKELGGREVEARGNGRWGEEAWGRGEELLL
eukprot:768477-Hanusia_phi.AAC.4